MSPFEELIATAHSTISDPVLEHALLPLSASALSIKVTPDGHSGKHLL